MFKECPKHLLTQLKYGVQWVNDHLCSIQIERFWNSYQIFNISAYKIVKGGELQEMESKGDQIQPRGLPHTYIYI
jgi:hypothetical protein